MPAGIKANSDGSAAIQVGGTDVITLTSGGAATFVTSPTTVQAGTAAAPSITFSGDTNTGIYSPGADQVAIATGGTAAIYANSSQQVGVGTTSPSYKLHVVGGNANGFLLDNGGQQYTQLLLQRNGAINTGGDILIDGTAGTVNIRGLLAGPLLFYTSSTAGNPVERARFNTTGAFVLAGGTTTADGIGITFPATQSASTNANTLDDYEEGTFTPVIVGTTTAGTGTYSTQYGVYTKIGRTVAVRISLRWSAHTGSGNMRLNGLPFTSGGIGDEFAIPSFFIYNITLSANNVITGYIGGAATSITIEQIATGGGTTAGVAMDTSGEFYATATYFV